MAKQQNRSRIPEDLWWVNLEGKKIILIKYTKFRMLVTKKKCW